MSVETATYISQLDATYPASGDPKSEGDNHLRLIKSTVKATFPNLSAAPVTPSTTELNYVTGVTSAIQTQINGETAARIANDNLEIAARITNDNLEIAARITNDNLEIAARITNDDLEIAARITNDNLEIAARIAADALKAPLESPVFTGTPTAPTPVTATTSTQLATTAFVHDVLNTAPPNTLPPLAAKALKVLRVNVGETAVEWGASITVKTYDQRGDLRTLTPGVGDAAVIDGLGLFVWQAGSTEPDDDESAFATASGVWLLEAAHWDLVDSWQAPEWQSLNDDDEDEPLRFASSFSSKVLTGSATCAITSVATVSSASFTGTVTGAALGDRVIATPPAQLGSTAADTGRLSYHAWASAANTVTIMLTNASAAVATTNTAIQTAWPITVIKS
jgi:hypothetical protein